jgi:hypothetical protein
VSDDLNLPYERVPGGPVYFEGDFIVAGGVVVRSAGIEEPEKLPALIFDFFLADGERLPSIALIMKPDILLPLSDIVRQAIRDAVRAVR